jgi:diguanylate cyclase (GGDEF)-like protein/putative nucleotidyltransferase with HDIG domain
MRAATFIALAVGVALLAGSIGLGVRDRSQKGIAVDHALTNKVDDASGQLRDYFERARSVVLITAHNPAFRDFYRLPGTRAEKVNARGREIRAAEEALDYLEELYPASIGEACFIDRSGAENARYVRGVRAGFADLSLTEAETPFFKPTFALQVGQVYQAKPYVSPDTKEWVIANSTPVPGTGSPAAAIVHFEVTIESFRRQAAAIADKYEILVVDAGTGAVVIDSRLPQRVGAPLGRRNDRRFSELAAVGRRAGTATMGDHRTAFRRLDGSAHNANDWYVVAIDPQPVGSLATDVGWAPIGMGAAALALLVLAAFSFRSSRRALHEAANTDALTGLGNRRRLLADLDEARASSASGERFALVLYDLDGFKAYNDNFGHLPGDALLRRLAAKLADATSDWGSAYRLGGDEFCVLAQLRRGEDAAGIAALGARVLSESGDGFAISASQGSVVIPDDAREPSELLAIADLRMYANKNSGRRSPARQTTDVLVRVQHERSALLGPHVSEVTELAGAVARRMGLVDRSLQLIEQAAQLHDIGKMAIPDAILDKEGPLTDEEWRLVREHTLIGERMLAAAPALEEVAKIVRASHERYDGEGYPDRLPADAIPLEAMIVSAADAFHAMTSDRPYRRSMNIEDAIAEIRRCAGSQFAPEVAEALIDAVAEAQAVRRRNALGGLRRAS